LNAAVLSNTSIGRTLLEKNKQLTAYRSKPESMPDVKMLTAEREELALDKQINKITFIDFWASWCGPCRKQVPDLKRIYQKYAGSDDIQFLSVSTDARFEAWTRALGEENMPWQQAVVKDPSNHQIVMDHWGVFAIPHGVIVDANGKTLANGFRSAGELEELLVQLLGR